MGMKTGMVKWRFLTDRVLIKFIRGTKSQCHKISEKECWILDAGRWMCGFGDLCNCKFENQHPASSIQYPASSIQYPASVNIKPPISNNGTVFFLILHVFYEAT
jgi:hypothetical protein